VVLDDGTSLPAALVVAGVGVPPAAALAEQAGLRLDRGVLVEVPSFWSQHYDMPISYVGHAEGWDRTEVAGSIAQRSCLVAYRVADRVSAVASVDRESLRAEALLERGNQAGLEDLLAGVRA
jgi:hypothetical protein